MPRPIIVRLPNWVGDVVMALPAIERLAQAGFDPWLVGKGWAASLLRGHGWQMATLPPTRAERILALRRWRDAARGLDPGFDRGPNMLLLPNSLSSAWEARRAGLRALGYRNDGRGLLLATALSPPRSPMHESGRFDRLAAALVAQHAATAPSAIAMTSRAALTRDPLQHHDPSGTPPLPEPEAAMPRLRIAAADADRAASLVHDRIGGRPYACIVPFATGRLHGRPKAWPGFATFARWLSGKVPVVIAPGPAEAGSARADFPTACALENVDLGTYAAVLAGARVVVANDTGPAHMAAAVGVPVVSVLGPTDARRHRPLGPQVTVVQADPWPEITAVQAATETVLRGVIRGPCAAALSSGRNGFG